MNHRGHQIENSLGDDTYTNILWNVSIAMLYLLPNHWMDYLHDVSPTRSLLHTMQHTNCNSCIMTIVIFNDALFMTHHCKCIRIQLTYCIYSLSKQVIRSNGRFIIISILIEPEMDNYAFKWFSLLSW